MAVYFIHCEEGGAIKIGHGRLPAHRVANLQSLHWLPLRLIGAMRGGREKEMEMHKRFAKHKTLGEWFKAEREILDFVDRLPLVDLAEMFRGAQFGSRFIGKNARTEAARVKAWKLEPPCKFIKLKVVRLVDVQPWSARYLP